MRLVDEEQNPLSNLSVKIQSTYDPDKNGPKDPVTREEIVTTNSNGECQILAFAEPEIEYDPIDEVHRPTGKYEFFLAIFDLDDNLIYLDGDSLTPEELTQTILITTGSGPWSLR